MKVTLISILLCAALSSFAQWNTSGTHIYNTNSGFVGIGTGSPNRHLTIFNTASNTYLNIKGNSGANEVLFGVDDSGGIVSTMTNHDLSLRAGGNQTFMTIKSTGNVGIGTTTPSEKLEIKSGQPSLKIGDSRDVSSFGGAYTEMGSIKFFHHYNTLIGAKIYTTKKYTDMSWGGADLRFAVSNIYNNSISDAMTITHVGNVGISTSSPISKLTIGQTISTITSTKGITLGSDQNTIEFLNSGYGSGYGAKLYGVDQGGGLTSFRIAVRGNSTTWNDALFIRVADTNAGNIGYVGIGTNSPDAKLTVKGSIHAEEVKVDLSVPGPDYVFEPTYNLSTLAEIETYIKANKHLPEIPSAKEMEINGINLSEMNMLLLKKVEELTLHLIGQQKQMEAQQNEIELLKMKIK